MKESACDAPPWSENQCRWLKSQFVLMMWFKSGKWSHWKKVAELNCSCRMSSRAQGLEHLCCEERSDSL